MDKKQKRTFYLTIVRSTFEHCSIIWHPKSPNQNDKFEAIQKRLIKWIHGRKFDHYKDNEFFDQQKELDILPIKFFLNDLALFYKIINLLVSINLHGHFIILQGDRVRCTRTTWAIICHNDTTLMKCNIRPNCESFKNCLYYRTMVMTGKSVPHNQVMWNRLLCNIRHTASISLFKSKLTNISVYGQLIMIGPINIFL